MLNAQSQIKIPLYYVAVPVHTQKCVAKVRQHAVLLPHEVFAAIVRNSVFSPEHLSVSNNCWLWLCSSTKAKTETGEAQLRKYLIKNEQYWRQAKDEAWCQQYPYAAKMSGCPSKCIPIKLHGDDASGWNIFSWQFLYVRRFSRISIAIQDGTELSCANETLMTVIGWSLTCLAEGVFPETDHKGVPFSDKYRQQKAGKLLADGFCGLFCGFTGDWKFFAQTFRLQQNYGCRQICHRCHVADTPLEDPASYRHLHVCEATQHRRTTAALQATAGSAGLLPGLHVDNIWPDWMHVACLGTQLRSAGSVLEELVVEGEFGEFFGPGKWDDRMNTCLQVAHLKFCQWMSFAHKASCFSSVFTVKGLSKSAGYQHPVLKAKARASQWINDWLLSIAQKNASTPHRQ